MADNKPKSTTVVLTREKFDAIPEHRAKYIGLYLLIFLAWAVATLTGFYFERTEVPAEAPPAETASAEAPPDAVSGEVAEEEPDVRVVYQWKWSPAVQLFQTAMIVGMIAFYWYFIRVLTLMGYPLPMILGYCAAVFLPVPGLLAIALVDRQVAKTWNKADDVFREAETAERRTATEQ